MAMTLLVNIDVDDLHKGIDFYTKAFGLTVGRRFGPDAVELLGASSPIYLLAKPNGTVASATSRHLRSYARHWTPIHLDIVVSEIEGAVDRARNAGDIVWVINDYAQIRQPRVEGDKPLDRLRRHHG